MDDSDHNNSLIEPDTPVDGDVQPFDMRELREIEEKGIGVCFISEDFTRRCQPYEIGLKGLENSTFIRQEGFELNVPESKFFFMRVADENGTMLTLALSPQMVWAKSGYWFTNELIEWATTNEQQLINIVLYTIKDIFDFFGFSYIEMFKKTGFSVLSRDLIYLVDSEENIQLVVEAKKDTLDLIEYRLRHYSVKYHNRCLWLGSKVTFHLDAYLSAFKSVFSSNEIADLEVGDLIRLKHKEGEKGVAYLETKAICQGLQSKNWVQKVFLRISNEDFKMEFEDDEWQLEDSDHDLDSSDGYGEPEEEFKFGEQGPDAIHLDLHIGSTTLSFNELCNVQEGSLIELKGSTLPMVLLKIGKETILEGELVRLHEQLMVQVIRKVE